MESSDSISAPRFSTGVWMYPGQPAGALADAVIAADELGLDEVWIADEGVAREPITVLAAAARSTRRVRLGIGITSPLLRHPGAIASSIATLDELSEGRAVLGLGVGGHESLGPFGLSTDRPVGVMNEAIEMCRAVLSGTATATYTPPPHAIPPRQVPIWVGARGPQLVRLAARCADGVFLSGCSAEQHDRIVDEVRRIAPIGVAIYQSVSNLSTGDNISSWETAGTFLAEELARFAPTSIGLNLIDLAQRHRVDPVEQVERAAKILAEAMRP